MPTRPALLLPLLAGLMLSSCVSIPDAGQRSASATQLAASHGWVAQPLHTGNFVLQAMLPPTPPVAERLTVYIEGDGLAWLNRDTPSFDPTPITPLALQLALQDDGPAAYLARPCQYLLAANPECGQRYWTQQRFAPELIAASNQALEQLKQRFQARQLVLVGYSGGAAVAALLAARRSDVAGLITVAGNLDHAAWTSQLALTPLRGSLNVADSWAQLLRVPQLHFVGADDSQTGMLAVAPFVQRFPPAQRPPVSIQAGFGHQCCWAASWPALLRQARQEWRAPAMQ